MPIDYKKYPENWKWLSKQTIKDAGDKCELCYAPNGKIVGRPTKKLFGHPWEWLEILDYSGCDYKETKIILTVHHIDGNPQNSSKHNLIALCQRCHLKLDMAKHVKNRKKNELQNCLEL